MKTKRNRKRSDNSVLYGIGNETYSDDGFPLRSVLMTERNVTVAVRPVTFCFSIEAQRNGFPPPPVGSVRVYRVRASDPQ